MSKRAALRRLLCAACGALAYTAAPVAAHPGDAAIIATLETLIRANPQVPALYLRRARAYAHAGAGEAALADLQRAEQLGGAAAAACDRGMVAYQAGDFGMARASLGTCLTQHPRRVDALLHRARAASVQHDAAAALADYAAYFVLDPAANPGDYTAAAELAADDPAHGPAAALAILDAGIARCGDVPALHRLAVDLETRRGEPLQALRRWQALQPRLGEDPSWWLALARLQCAAHQPAAALQARERAAVLLAAARPTPARRDSARELQLDAMQACPAT